MLQLQWLSTVDSIIISITIWIRFERRMKSKTSIRPKYKCYLYTQSLMEESPHNHSPPNSTHRTLTHTDIRKFHSFTNQSARTNERTKSVVHFARTKLEKSNGVYQRSGNSYCNSSMCSLRISFSFSFSFPVWFCEKTCGEKINPNFQLCPFRACPCSSDFNFQSFLRS